MVTDLAIASPSLSQSWPVLMTPWLKAVFSGRSSVDLPVQSDSSWRKWQQAMDGHGLLPIIYNWLKDLPDSCVPPPPLMAAIQQAYLREAALVAVRHRQLKRLLEPLSEVVQPILVLKGAALAETVYADPALRPATDIDLLVRPEGYAEARRVLQDVGYRSRKGRRPSQADWAGEEEFIFQDELNSFMVDLHWTISPFAWPEQSQLLETLFTNADVVETDGQRMSVLATTDALVHAALHLIYANFENVRLIWVHDIHLLANVIEERGQWSEVFGTAVAQQGRLALVDALLLAQEWFGTPLPPGLLARDYFPATATEWEIYRIIHGSETTQERLQQLRLANLNRSQRLSYFCERLLPTGREIDLNYPRFRKWPYPLKIIGRLSTILMARRNHG